MLKAGKHNRRVSNRTGMIEALEARAYFDLVPSFQGVVPVTIIPTLRNSSHVTVELTNNGLETVSGAYTVTLLTSTSPSLTGATPVTTITRSGTFAVNRPRPVSFSLTDFPDVPDGQYYLLAEVTGPLAGVGDNATASVGTVGVTDPYLDLSDSVIITSAASDQVLPGRRVSFSLEVFNTGNIAATGNLVTDVDLTADAGATEIPVNVISPRINVRANGHQTLRVTEKIPTGFAPGTYSWDVNIDPANTFGETSIANNTALSTSELTVEPPYPDMLGTFTGPDKITHGPSRGASPTISLDFTSESQTTGALVATGTLYASTTSTFQLTGTISTTGVFKATGSSMTSVYVATYRGRLIGSKLTGTVVNTDGNSGVFTLLLGA
jgi:hypothetical protein